MNYTHRNNPVRLIMALLVTVAVIVLSGLATHAPAGNQSSLTLKSIRTDKATSFYANARPDCAWFVEAVYANQRPSCAWFVEAVLSTGENDVADNLKSVAATL